MSEHKTKSIYFVLQSTFSMKKSLGRSAALFVLLAMLLSSCRIFDPSVMLRTKRDYPYAQATDTLPSEYIIQSGDLLNFRLYSNEGFRIIDINTSATNQNQINLANQNMFNYLIEADSSINLPIVGRMPVAGMNLKQAELFLEDKFSNYYNDPYVIMEVRNRRITVFPGEGGAAKVIQITNEYVTIVEALALAGGISGGGKAHKVKVIRGSLNEPEIYKLDMSTPEGLAEAKLHYVRANDIIYVEPSYFAGKQILTTTGQIFSLITAGAQTLLVILLFDNRVNGSI